MASLCRLFGCRFSKGRAEGALSLKRAGVAERLFMAEAVYAVEGRSESTTVTGTQLQITRASGCRRPTTSKAT